MARDACWGAAASHPGCQEAQLAACHLHCAACLHWPSIEPDCSGQDRRQQAVTELPVVGRPESCRASHMHFTDQAAMQLAATWSTAMQGRVTTPPLTCHLAALCAHKNAVCPAEGDGLQGGRTLQAGRHREGGAAARTAVKEGTHKLSTCAHTPAGAAASLSQSRCAGTVMACTRHAQYLHCCPSTSVVHACTAHRC